MNLLFQCMQYYLLHNAENLLFHNSLTLPIIKVTKHIHYSNLCNNRTTEGKCIKA